MTCLLIQENKKIAKPIIMKSLLPTLSQHKKSWLWNEILPFSANDPVWITFAKAAFWWFFASEKIFLISSPDLNLLLEIPNLRNSRKMTFCNVFYILPFFKGIFRHRKLRNFHSAAVKVARMNEDKCSFHELFTSLCENIVWKCTYWKKFG